MSIDAINEEDRKESAPDTKHNEPLRLLDAVSVGLRVTERLDVDLVGLVDLASSTVTDEDGLSTPLRKEKQLNIDKRQTGKNTVRTLMMTFLPSGMLVKSTSTLANARTSDDADMLVKKSVTVDLAPAAVTRPIVPTMKYEKARPES
jgi:hypothetical protein